MKRRASEAMEYFAAATQLQQSTTYKTLPTAIMSVATGVASNSSSSAASHRAPTSSVAATSAIPAFLTELLPSSALSASFHSKLHNKFLQLASSQPTHSTATAPATTAQPAKQRRRQQQKRRQAAGDKRGRRGTEAAAAHGRPLTARQRKQTRLFSLPPPLPDSSPAVRYSSFAPLHALWLSYLRDLLAQPHSALPLSAGERLLKADYHGAKVTVTRSTAPSYVHLRGILIQESSSGWRIIGEDNGVRLVRKEGSVLQLSISGEEDEEQQQQSSEWQVELYGDQLAVRSSERAAKKFKGKSNIQLNG